MTFFFDHLWSLQFCVKISLRGGDSPNEPFFSQTQALTTSLQAKGAFMGTNIKRGSIVEGLSIFNLAQSSHNTNR